MVKKKFITFCIDVEAFDLPSEFGKAISKEQMYGVSLEGLSTLSKIINEFNIKFTFFLTKDWVMSFPEEIASLAAGGHEIALHSVIEEAGRTESVLKELSDQKAYIESITGREIFGHRSHKLFPVPLKTLRQAGFRYDNSLHPTYVPGRYCNIFKSRQLYRENGIVEVPITVIPLLRIPFSCFWFRLFRVPYVKLCTDFTYFMEDYINIYFHSWDFANIDDILLNWPSELLLQNTGDKLVRDFKNYLKFLFERNISIISMFEYVQNRLTKETTEGAALG